MSIKIPDRLLDRLESDALLAAHVRESVELFAPWFQLSGLPFFPDFTDHGLEHVSLTLRTAEGLITDDAWEVLTSADSAILILATLLHDAALHFREQTFHLLTTSCSNQQIAELGDRPWSELWLEFLADARRFDAKQLHRVFGDADPVTLPGEDWTSWTRRERLLIGEFLRRHHPRVAHQVAVHGVPGIGSDRLRLPQGLNELADLAGLVGRSHGMAIRSTLPYLQTRFGGTREYKGCHAVFIMAVLRLSDYMQLQASRAPKQLLQVANIRSPVSKGEWRAHAAVRDITHVGDDPEAITVHAVPSDVRSFLRIRSWLDDIQRELDSSWAVLGEVYGRVPPLNRLGVSLRRVRSNLDNVEDFGRSVPYIPAAAAFSTADAALLKLLAIPLYGDEPAVGIRELLQNAVDAVRERAAALDNAGTMEGGVSAGKETDVSIRLAADSNGSWWLELDDRGIGMPSQTVTDYFLRAGASYRYSDAWRRTFEDASGHSRVLRSGRFGVGAIAGFLLGDEIEVVTRHVNSPLNEGVAFRAGLDDDVVELRKVECAVGTTIRVRLRDRAIAALQLKKIEISAASALSYLAQSWDWYCLNTPKVERNVGKVKLQQAISLQAAGETLLHDWQRIAASDYQDVQWSFSDGLPPLVVNGIRVAEKAFVVTHDSRETEPTLFLRSAQGEYGFRQPSVSVFDPNGRLPLNLQRTALAVSDYPFKDMLRESIARQFVAEVAVHGPTRIPKNQKEWMDLAKWDARGLHTIDAYGSHRVTWGMIYTTTDGFGVSDAELIASAKIDRVSVVPFRVFRSFNWSPAAVDMSDGTAIFPVWLDFGNQALYRFLRRCLYPVFDGTDRGGVPFAYRPLRGARLLLTPELAKDARSVLRRAVIGAIQEEEVAPKWLLWSIGDTSQSLLEPKTILSALELTSANSNSVPPEIFAELSVGACTSVSVTGVIAQILRQAFDGPVIPYDRKKRIDAVRELGSEWEVYLESAKNRILPSRRYPYWTSSPERDEGDIIDQTIDF
jgi:hypothetical protein